MQKQINVNPRHSIRSTSNHLTTTAASTLSKQVHELMIIKLRLQQPIQRHLCKSTRNHHRTLATLNLKDTRLIRRDSNVQAVPHAFVVSRPRDQDALLGQVPGRVLERTKAVLTARVLQFALVVVLAGEGEEELLLALLGLQSHHGLFNVVVVTLQLRFQEMCLLVQSSECSSYTLQLFSTLDAAAVLRPDVDCDSIEKILVVVRVGDAACALELHHVL